MVHIAVYSYNHTTVLSYCDTNDIFQIGEKAKRNPFSTIAGGMHTLNNLYYRLETYPLSTANNRNNNKLCSIPQ